MSLTKRIAKRVFRIQPFGTWCSRGLDVVGFKEWSKAISHFSDYVPPEVEIEIPDATPLRMSSLDGNDLVAHLIWRHGWTGFERPMPALYAEVARHGEVFVGVGANSGFYELITAAVSKSDHIYAFEPYPPAIEAFQQNVTLNSMDDRIVLVQKAIADSDGTMQLYIPEVKFGSVLESSASLNQEFRPKHSKVIDVETIKLDTFAQETGLDRIDLLRIDVEGAELQVLAGANEVLAKHRPYVFLEVLASADVDQLGAYFSQHEYVALWFDENDALRQDTVLVFRETNDNQVLCPKEKVSDFETIAKKAGLQIRR